MKIKKKCHRSEQMDVRCSLTKLDPLNRTKPGIVEFGLFDDDVTIDLFAQLGNDIELSISRCILCVCIYVCT